MWTRDGSGLPVCAHPESLLCSMGPGASIHLAQGVCGP